MGNKWIKGRLTYSSRSLLLNHRLARDTLVKEMCLQDLWKYSGRERVRWEGFLNSFTE